MFQDLFPQSWLVNTLLDEGFVAQKITELARQPLPYGLTDWLDTHFDVASLSQRSEAQLEERFIGPLLTQLGWISVTQQTITVQGKLAKPDWCLLLAPGQDNALIASKDHTLITAICESKAWDKTLDTGKADRTFTPLFDVQSADVPFTARAKDQLRAENDKTVARLYGISDAEFTHLLRSFKGMATKRPEYLALLQ